ncbi:MAG: HEAT repeat domain-containing protein, partial [Acidobacteriota bacterium]
MTIPPNHYQTKRYVQPFWPLACALIFSLATVVLAQETASRPSQKAPTAGIPRTTMLQIIRGEDERRWDNDLISLLSDKDPGVRMRAALAAGRIGDELAVLPLISLLETDQDYGVRAVAAFALGETESAAAAEALNKEIGRTTSPAVKARAVEALGKIVAAMPATEEARKRQLGKSILEMLNNQAQRKLPDSETILLGLTAVLRARPEGAGKVVSQFLSYSDPRIRADAGNTLARLKANDGNEQLRTLLTSDPDPIVRANAARVLGATEDKASSDKLLDRALNDQDSRVRVSAMRALAALKDQAEARSIGHALFAQGGCQRRLFQVKKVLSHARDLPDCLELITTLGRLFQGSDDEKVYGQIAFWRDDFPVTPPEVEIAMARISPTRYMRELQRQPTAKLQAQRVLFVDWRSSVDRGLGEIATVPDATESKTDLAAQAQALLSAMLDVRDVVSRPVHAQYAIPDVLRAYAAFKPKDLDRVLRKHLSDSDVIIRATAAELLGELTPDEANTQSLIAALPVALVDKQLNDAALSMLDSLAKQ